MVRPRPVAGGPITLHTHCCYGASFSSPIQKAVRHRPLFYFLVLLHLPPLYLGAASVHQELIQYHRFRVSVCRRVTNTADYARADIRARGCGPGPRTPTWTFEYFTLMRLPMLRSHWRSFRQSMGAERNPSMLNA